MTTRREVGDFPTYMADDGVGFDQEGYILSPGADGDRNVKKASEGDAAFVGVNHMSTYNHDNTEVLTGEPLAVIQEGVPNVLCVDGATYNFGDMVSLSGTPGVGDKVADTSGDTTPDIVVGKVMYTTDLSGGDGSGIGLVPVNITGYV